MRENIYKKIVEIKDEKNKLELRCDTTSRETFIFTILTYYIYNKTYDQMLHFKTF